MLSKESNKNIGGEGENIDQGQSECQHVMGSIPSTTKEKKKCASSLKTLFKYKSDYNKL
jgi:hypothetical protein